MQLCGDDQGYMCCRSVSGPHAWWQESIHVYKVSDVRTYVCIPDTCVYAFADQKIDFHQWELHPHARLIVPLTNPAGFFPRQFARDSQSTRREATSPFGKSSIVNHPDPTIWQPTKAHPRPQSQPRQHEVPPKNLPCETYLHGLILIPP